MTHPEFSRDATAEGSSSFRARSTQWYPLVASSVDSSAPDVDHPAPDEAIAASAANDGAENASPVDDKAAGGEAQVGDVAAARTEPSSSDPSSAAAWGAVSDEASANQDASFTDTSPAPFPTRSAYRGGLGTADDIRGLGDATLPTSKMGSRPTTPSAVVAYPGGRRSGSAVKHRKESHSKWRWLGEVTGVLAGAVLIAFLLRMFVVQVYQIPSGSMTETLQVGSRIAVNRVPGVGNHVERGDVIVFQDDLEWLPSLGENSRNPLVRVGEFLGVVPADGEQVLVKRIIGVGGDTVECCSSSGNLIVNGTEIDEPYAQGSSSSGFKVTVPEGYLWVMGDNRTNSADSLYHYTQGDPAFVSEDSVIGRAMWEIWPISAWSSLGDRDVFEDVR